MLKKILFYILFISLTVFLISKGFDYYKDKIGTSTNTVKIDDKDTTPVSPPIEDNSELFTGKVKKLTQDLGIAIATEDDKLNDFIPKTTYYEAGTYKKGKYKGYTRYIAIRESMGPGGSSTYIFASKDQKEYILDKSKFDEYLYTMDDLLYGLDSKKVTKVEYLDSEHPAYITLNDKIGMYRDGVSTKTIKKDETTYEDTLLTNFTNYKKLNSLNSNQRFFQENYELTEDPENLKKYIDGKTIVYVVDSTGFSYSYVMGNLEKIKDFPKLREEYLKADAEYQKNPDSSKYPEYPIKASLKLSSNDIKSQKSHYNEYDLAIPHACANDLSSLIIKNISDQDVEYLGSSIYGDIYTLKDKNHPLYKAQYDSKFGSGFGAGNAFNENYEEIPIPTIKEYVNKNPLLLFQDPWNRWVMVGEYYYYLEGGCGKPVIYLYPTKPTEVSVEMTSPIKFKTTIPNYKDGWLVKAYPNGNLVDLRPKETECSSIDTSTKGSEYAGEACKNNSYPYIYWSGRSTEKTYPDIKEGWIVEKSDLKTFMSTKLDEIGFNNKEKQDMLEYWMPQMLKKNTPYYRISFLQTNEMNNIAPMKITPEPKSVYRFFLDYLPLNEMPVTKLEPQKLSRIVRDGFTVVEWGGLKR